MTKTTRARYTLEFKQEAVRLVEGGQSQAAVARHSPFLSPTQRPTELNSAT
jgi:transposase-like protein